MDSKVTLSIDFGYKNIGVALVRNEAGVNTPLFAGTLLYDPIQLSTKVEPRAQLRRMRRTRKTKRNRLRRLETSLLSLGIVREDVKKLITFCKRRGYASLFEEADKSEQKAKKDKSEMVFRFSREEFFGALEEQIALLLLEEKRVGALAICEAILNKVGNRTEEVRPIRIENRGSSRCAWNGCEAVTPRRDNALRDPLSQFVHTVYAASLKNNEALRQQVTGMLDHLETLGKRLRNVNGSNPEAERKHLKKKIGEELKLLKTLSGLNPDLSEEDKSSSKAWTVIRRNIMNLIEQTGGRNRFCRKHSQLYETHLLEGKPIPFKQTMSEKDLVSRREEILFQKLWRYIEARILTLAPDGIDRVIVERTAIDLLAGSRKQRQEISNKNALEEMYQQGPRYGFKNNLEMLREEFNGLCAYCGQPGTEIVQKDHILPQSRFFFDSYLNVVPACPSCNQTLKQAGSPGGSGLRISEQAYEAYSQYLSNKFKDKPPHLLHTMKKGILNLMRQPDRIWESERYLSLIANQFAQVVGTQRGPRPFARFLSHKLNQHSGKMPHVGFVNGRHTSLWRNAAYPNFDKIKEKAEGGIINHGLDALIMACDLPDITPLEARHLNPATLSWWTNRVRRSAPPEGPDGIPNLAYPTSFVQEFERVHPGNFVEVALAKMNWNRKDSHVQRQDAYGWSKSEDVPVKRVTASSIAEDLRNADKKESSELRRAEVKKVVDIILHPRLRQIIQTANTGDSPGANTIRALTEWLRKAIKGNLGKTAFSPHPADQLRSRMLHEFLDGHSNGIPAFIGIKIKYPSVKKNVDLNRADPKTGRIIHRYVADPANIGMIVAYKGSNGNIDRQRPFTLEWRQNWTVIPGVKLFGPVPDGPLKGRALGERMPDQGQWRTELHRYLTNAGMAEYTIVSQGNVAVYQDGSESYIRNFSSSYGFKKSLLKGVIGIKRSPLSQKVISNNRLLLAGYRSLAL